MDEFLERELGCIAVQRRPLDGRAVPPEWHIESADTARDALRPPLRHVILRFSRALRPLRPAIVLKLARAFVPEIPEQCAVLDTARAPGRLDLFSRLCAAGGTADIHISSDVYVPSPACAGFIAFTHLEDELAVHIIDHRLALHSAEVARGVLTLRGEEGAAAPATSVKRHVSAPSRARHFMFAPGEMPEFVPLRAPLSASDVRAAVDARARWAVGCSTHGRCEEQRTVPILSRGYTFLILLDAIARHIIAHLAGREVHPEVARHAPRIHAIGRLIKTMRTIECTHTAARCVHPMADGAVDPRFPVALSARLLSAIGSHRFDCVRGGPDGRTLCVLIDRAAGSAGEREEMHRTRCVTLARHRWETFAARGAWALRAASPEKILYLATDLLALDAEGTFDFARTLSLPSARGRRAAEAESLLRGRMAADFDGSLKSILCWKAPPCIAQLARRIGPEQPDQKIGFFARRRLFEAFLRSVGVTEEEALELLLQDSTEGPSPQARRVTEARRLREGIRNTYREEISCPSCETVRGNGLCPLLGDTTACIRELTDGRAHGDSVRPRPDAHFVESLRW